MRTVVFKNIIRGLMLLTAVVVSGQLAEGARPAAKVVLESAAKKLREAPSLTAAFKITQGTDASQGSLTISGTAFRMQTPEMHVWFDGKTQWAYSPASREVNITTPTADEIAESNPLSVLTSMTSAYTCRRLSSSATVDKIELVPKGKADISKAVVTINNATGYPTEIMAYRANGAVTRIAVSTIKTGKKQPAGSFRFNPKAYPGVEVVDLR